MDSLTQAALGAAVGHVVAGEKGGVKALVAGAVAGTIPDLDILFYPVIDSVSQLGFHRGFSHSILFTVLAAPLFGLAVGKLARGAPVTWMTWSWLGFWALLTHIILDTFTVYGTGLFEPFSDSRPALNLIFIIDPLYTLPLLAGLLAAALVGPAKRKAVKWTWVGLGLSSAYLVWAGIAKTLADQTLKEEFMRIGVTPIRYMSAPTPSNTLLWRALAETEDGYVELFYSVVNDEPPSEPNYIPKNHELLAPVRETRAGKTATWFSQGYYSVSVDGSSILLHDLRFGQVGFQGGPFALTLAFIDDKDGDDGPGLQQRWGWSESLGPVFGEVIERAF